jgi:hypothetical protein
MDNIPRTCFLNYEIVHSNNVLKVNPYLYDDLTCTIYEYKQKHFTIFKEIAYANMYCVIIRIESNKYIVNPLLITSIYDVYGDNDICFDKYRIDCYPKSKLWRTCKLSIRHNQPFSIRIHNYRLLI